MLIAANSRLGRNAAWVFAGQLTRVGLQGAYFLILARVLGVDGFGAFAGVVALAALAAPYASLGALNLLVKHVSTGSRSALVQFSNGVLVTLGVGGALTVLLVVAAPAVAPLGVLAGTVALIAAADIVAANLIMIAGALGQARERLMSDRPLPDTAQRRSAGRPARGAGADRRGRPDRGRRQLRRFRRCCSRAASPWRSSAGWAASGPSSGPSRPRWREGLLFAVSQSSQNVYNDIDKTMLARLDSLGSAGIFAAAFRIVDFAFVPMRAALAAAYPRFFTHGEAGLRSALRVTRKIAAPGLAYSVVVGGVLLLGLNAIPVVLGAEYSPSVGAVQLLAVLPLLRWVHYLAADSLTGAGRQGARTACQVGVAVANVGLNFWLIPAYSWTGAAVSTLVCDGLLGVGLWSVVLAGVRSERRADPAGPGR